MMLLIGHGRHGKDEVAKILQQDHGITCLGSSEVDCRLFIYNILNSWGYDYPNVDACYEDRLNHREVWKILIQAYNYNDKSKLATEIYRRAECYVGMHKFNEYGAVVAKFNPVVVWVDRSYHVDKDPTMEIAPFYCDLLINNNGPLSDLRGSVAYMVNQYRLLASGR